MGKCWNHVSQYDRVKDGGHMIVYLSLCKERWGTAIKTKRPLRVGPKRYTVVAVVNCICAPVEGVKELTFFFFGDFWSDRRGSPASEFLHYFEEKMTHTHLSCAMGKNLKSHVCELGVNTSHPAQIIDRSSMSLPLDELDLSTQTDLLAHFAAVVLIVHVTGWGPIYAHIL